MKAFIGLGNPDAHYVGTRHNIGFFILDQIVNPSTFKVSKYDYYISKTLIDNQEILLIKPSTYMNNSGIAVKQLLKAEPNLTLEDIIIVYDDYHLPLGKVRFRPKGSDGGHNGIKSIIYELESDEFQRLRFGIDEPIGDLVDYVLSPFKRQEEDLMNRTVDRSIEALNMWVSLGITKTMTTYNSTSLS